MEPQGNSKIFKILFLIVVVVVLVGGGLYFTLGKKKMVSPLPSESTIRVIFISPTNIPATIASTPSATLQPTKKASPTRTPPTASPKPTAITPTKSVSPTQSASASATPKP